MKNWWKNFKFERYIFGILLAVEIIMSFTFLGYVHVPPVSITTAYFPVIITASLFGTGESTVAGLIFGLGSMYKASALYVMPNDMIFSPFRTSVPVSSILLSVGTRTLFGFVIGFLFSLVKRNKHKNILKVILSFIAPKIHAFFVFLAMGTLFPSSGLNYKTTFELSRNDFVIAISCVIYVMVSNAIYNSKVVTKYKEAVNDSENSIYMSSKMSIGIGIVGIFTFLMAVFSTIYFSDRMQYMLNEYGIGTTDILKHDILHLQVEFLAAMLALDFILMLIILIVYRYMKYKEYIGEMDFLTEVMGRRLFLHYCAKCQTEEYRKYIKNGWFLFLDIDWFKQINDTLGHSVGDMTLKTVAKNLYNIFEPYGAVGRVGGDEFAVIIEKEMDKDELKEKLEKFLSDISGILPDRKVSCSIGAYHFEFPMDVTELLRETDNVLYQAKANGKSCFVIQDEILKDNG